MKVRSANFVGGVALAVAALAAVPVGASASAPLGASRHHPGASARPWTNARLSPDRRAQLLVAQMTLDEKIAMVHGTGYPIGSGYAGVVPANSRLGIPA